MTCRSDVVRCSFALVVSELHWPILKVQVRIVAPGKMGVGDVNQKEGWIFHVKALDGKWEPPCTYTSSLQWHTATNMYPGSHI